MKYLIIGINNQELEIAFDSHEALNLARIHLEMRGNEFEDIVDAYTGRLYSIKGSAVSYMIETNR